MLKRVAVVFEYPTVNGGENSMLAVLEPILAAGQIEVVALAPPDGPLSERIDRLGQSLRKPSPEPSGAQSAVPVEQRSLLRRVDFSMTDDAGHRLDRAEILSNLIEALAPCPPDVIHANSLTMGRLLGAFQPELPIPTTCHLRDIMKLSGAAIRDLNRHARLIAVSQATADFHGGQGLDHDRIEVVYNGIAVPDDGPAEQAGRQNMRQQIREQLGIAPQAPVMLTVGQIGLRKGLDTLAAAAEIVSRQIPDTHWLLAGERFSGKDESIRFEQQVVDRFRAAQPALTFHRLGYCPNVPELMLAADMLVHAARQEPLGRVILEACASGLPVVATDVGGTAEIIEHEASGMLVQPDDSAALADQVRRLITDAGLRTRLATAAKHHVRARFSLAASASNLLAQWSAAMSAR